ncbi:aminotransferase, partial [Xanthomonas perforans]
PTITAAQLQDRLYDAHAIDVAVAAWAMPSGQLVRLSAQVYNALDDYARLGEALAHCLAAPSDAQTQGVLA